MIYYLSYNNKLLIFALSLLSILFFTYLEKWSAYHLDALDGLDGVVLDACA